MEIRLCIQDLHSRIVSRQVFVVEQGIVSAAFLLFTLSFFKAFDASFVHVHLQMHRIYATSQVGTDHFIAGFNFENCNFIFHSYFFIELYDVLIRGLCL